MNPKQSQANVRVPMHLCPPVLPIRVAAMFRTVNQLPGRYPFNWRDNDVSLATYLDAIKRHIAKIEDGEWDDPSGHSHIAHIAGNCAILLDAELKGTLHCDLPEGTGQISDLLDEYSDKYKAELEEKFPGVVRFEDGKDCGDPNCKAAECLATRMERMQSIDTDETEC